MFAASHRDIWLGSITQFSRRDLPDKPSKVFCGVGQGRSDKASGDSSADTSKPCLEAKFRAVGHDRQLYTDTARFSPAVAPPLLNWPTKDPGDTLDYEVDISPALIGNDGGSIATLDVSVSPDNPGDLSVASMTADGTRCVFWLTEGQNGTIYTVTIIVGTANGRTIQPERTSASLEPVDSADTRWRARDLILGQSSLIRMVIQYFTPSS